MRRAPNTLYTYDGKTMTLTRWAAHLGVSYVVLSQRQRRWGNNLAVLFTPGLHPHDGRKLDGSIAYKGKVYEFGGQRHTIKEWKQLGYDVDVLLSRRARGMPEEQLLLAGTMHRYWNDRVTWRGRTLSKAEWGKELGISRQRVQQRLAKYPIDEALGMLLHVGRRGKIKRG